MPRSVIFETEGPLDLRAITCVGVNTKPRSSSPIGQFGTGLKYSVAVLCRESIGVTVVTSGEVYAFYRKTERFRDKDFDFIRMKRETLQRTLRSRAQYSELNYTTEYGKYWQLWQVYRELHSNTLDEGGTVYTVEDLEAVDFQPDRTYFVVTGERFAEEYDNRHRTFLPDGLTVVRETERLQVLERPSQHVYYRGMRVYDLDKPAQFTYNFLNDVELTEDRTAKNSMALRTSIEEYMLADAPAHVVEQAVAAPEGSFESELTYTNHWREPSAAFTQAVAASPVANPTAAAYVRKRGRRAAGGEPLQGRPRPWRLQAGYVVDADGNPVLRYDINCGLEPIQMQYVLALLNRDLYGYELDQWLEQQSGEAPQEELADVLF